MLSGAFSRLPAGSAKVGPLPCVHGMDTRDFLHTVLPQQGVKFLQFGRTPLGGTIRSEDVDDIVDVAWRKDRRGLNTWMATASFDPEGPLNKYNNLGRFAESAIWMRTAWQDWDADPAKAIAYTTLDEAKAAALAFYAQLLPAGEVPLLVRSGGGIHSYVPFTADVPADQWVEVAMMVKALGMHWKYRFDRTRAADAASLMRPAGTRNYKKAEPRPVVVLNPGTFTTMDWEVYAGHVRALFDEVKPRPVPKTAVPSQSATDALDSGGAFGAVAALPSTLNTDISDRKPARFGPILEQCHQMQFCAAHQAQVSEPLWRAALSVAGRTAEGTKAIHWLSREHPDYSAELTEVKFLATAGPHTCEQFEQHREGGCDGCPNRTRVRSPITLGLRTEAATTIEHVARVAAPATVAASAAAGFGNFMDGVELSEPDSPEMMFENVPVLDHDVYKYTGEKLIRIFRKTTKDNNGKEQVQEFEITMLNHKIYPLRSYADNRDSVASQRSSAWYIELPGAAPTTQILSHTDRVGKDSFPRWCANSLDYTPMHPEDITHLRNAMSLWLEKLKGSHSMEIPQTMGWFDIKKPGENETAFVLGNRILTQSGIKTIHTSSHLGDTTLFEPTGNLDEWLRVYNRYSSEEMMFHAVATLVAFAAPLISMTPLASLPVILQGKSGGGKTTIQKFCSSIYGAPRSLMIGSDGTLLAKLKYVHNANNLPLMIDDWVRTKPEELIEFCFTVSNGNNREGLTRSGGINKERGGSWRTAVITSTNIDINDAIKNHYPGDKKAARLRILRIPIPRVQWGEEISAETDSVLQANYGWAGEAYLERVRSNRTKIKRQVELMMARLEKEWSTKSEERYFTQGCAAILTAYYHAREAGVCPFDQNLVWEGVRRVFEASRTEAADSTLDAKELLATYINDNAHNIITTKAGKLDAQSDVLLSSDRRQLVVGRLVQEFNEDPGQLWLLVAPFRHWCRQRHVSSAMVIRDLYETGITAELESSVNLGHRLPTLHMAKAKGLIIDNRRMRDE